MPQLNSLSDYLSMLNQQLNSHWILFEYHRQLDSLLRIILEIDFLNEQGTAMLEHLQVLGSVIKQARTCNVSLLSKLIYMKELLVELDEF